MHEIKPVGLCPRCQAVPRLPGYSYCGACRVEVNKEQRHPRRSTRRVAPPAEPPAHTHHTPVTGQAD